MWRRDDNTMTTRPNEISQSHTSSLDEFQTDKDSEQTRANRTQQQISSAVLNLNTDMSTTKQCISCNREMPVSSEACVCGHVVSDIKSLGLGGKRYSGYREELYSRMEIRRILGHHDKPKRPKLKQRLPNTKQRITSSLHKPQMKGRRKRKHLVVRENDPQTQTMSNSGSQPTRFDDQSDAWYLNPRFNFTDALADINKRLISQTSFWIKL